MEKDKEMRNSLLPTSFPPSSLSIISLSQRQQTDALELVDEHVHNLSFPLVAQKRTPAALRDDTIVNLPPLPRLNIAFIHDVMSTMRTVPKMADDRVKGVSGRGGGGERGGGGGGGRAEELVHVQHHGEINKVGYLLLVHRLHVEYKSHQLKVKERRQLSQRGGTNGWTCMRV